MIRTCRISVGPRLELKPLKLCQILLTSANFGRDWAEFVEIMLDLDKISPDLDKISPDLEVINPNLD